MNRKQMASRINLRLNQIGVIQLPEWLKAVSNLHDDLSTALEGIYCGTEGKVHEPLAGEFEGLYLDFGWYKDPNAEGSPKVEYAYVS
jgi:hypothetical protein